MCSECYDPTEREQEAREQKHIATFREMIESELREQIAKEIENAVIEVVGNSAHTLNQAARIARGGE